MSQEKKHGAARHWCFTSFKGSMDFRDLVRGYAYQQEKCPKSGRLHFQGYCEFSRPVRMQQAKEQLNDQSCHVEPRIGTREAAIAYCTKEATRIDGPWVSGSCESKKGQGRRSDLQRAAEDLKANGLESVKESFPVEYIKYHRGIEKLAESYAPAVPTWRNMHVTWVWGPSGCGKTKMAYEMDPGLYRLMLPNKNGVIWWDGYTGQKTVLIDDLDGEIPFRTLLHYLDRYPLKVQTKGGTINVRYEHVIITSNPPMETMYHSIDITPLQRRVDCVLAL